MVERHLKIQPVQVLPSITEHWDISVLVSDRHNSGRKLINPVLKISTIHSPFGV